MPILTLNYNVAAQWGAADAEIKVPSVENTELNPFSAKET